ncbi:MAG: hypothetical protein KDA91_07200 [Planctomycetaceae bacterium]|nr:hypothetical protein [Planctomycetaceae bacterium]
MNDELQNEIRELLSRGQNIEAIKRVREETGWNLAEAKRAVEQLIEAEHLDEADANAPSDGKGDLQEIVALLQNGRKLEAIKLFRNQTRAGLKEAKQAVELIAAKHGIEEPKGSGCLSIVVLLVITAFWLAR